MTDKELLKWDFRKDVTKYLKLSTIPKCTLGRIVFNDPRWVGDVFREYTPRNPRVAQLRKLYEFLNDNGYFDNPENIAKYKKSK